MFERIQKQLKHVQHLDPPSFALKSTAAAVTEALGINISDNDQHPVNVWTRPLVILPPHILKYVVAPLKFHEYIHVRQLHESPVQIRDSESYRISNELEAYDLQNEFNTALLRTGFSEYSHDVIKHGVVSEIASICDLNPPEDRYAPTPVIRNLLKAQQLDL